MMQWKKGGELRQAWEDRCLYVDSVFFVMCTLVDLCSYSFGNAEMKMFLDGYRWNKWDPSQFVLFRESLRLNSDD